MLPIVIPPIILNTPFPVMWLYITLANAVTLLDHSGLNLPINTKAKEHDLHHEKFIFNYGGCGWLDLLHGSAYKAKSE
jgi:sterol desaturase/sphingolipid hydroxylase (fatty acid hydroxylase superfamily)